MEKRLNKDQQENKGNKNNKIVEREVERTQKG